jgi:hypothetical protein
MTRREDDMSGTCKYCGKGLTQDEMADHTASCKEMNRDYQPDDIEIPYNADYTVIGKEQSVKEKIDGIAELKQQNIEINAKYTAACADIGKLEQKIVEKDADIKALMESVEEARKSCVETEQQLAKANKANDDITREKTMLKAARLGYELARWLVIEKFNGSDVGSFDEAIAAREEAKGERK